MINSFYKNIDELNQKEKDREEQMKEMGIFDLKRSFSTRQTTISFSR